MSKAIANPADDFGGNQLTQDLDTMTNEEILVLFERTMECIYQRIGEASFLLLALEKRGYDTRKLRRSPIVEAVRNVGIGILIKEAVARYFSRSDILRYITALPIDEQKKLVDDGSVKGYDHIGGKGTHRLVEIDELTPREAVLVFDMKNHRVREPGEQAMYLQRERIEERMTKAAISHDDRSGLMNCKNATASQIKAYMKKH